MDETYQLDSTSRSTVLERQANMNSGVKSQRNGREALKKVSLYMLFSFADSWDKVLMTFGTIGAVGHGLSQPIMALIFGELMDAFGKSQRNYIISLVSKVSLKFVYLAMGCGIAAFLQVSCWMITGERQAARIRSLYLKALLRQEIAYFDQEVCSGEITECMSGDTVLIQHAMGEKVGKFVEVVASFLGGFIIAFAKGWLLALVLVSVIPLLFMSGAVMLVLRSKIDSQAQNAYVSAATVVQQTIGCIRTVASFTGEKRSVANYRKFLASSYRSGVKEGLYSGLGFGFVVFTMFCSYALAVWFGSKMILHNGYTGGQVFTVLITVILSSMMLSQATPAVVAFRAGQAAGFKMFETLNRKPRIDVYDRNGKILNDIQGAIELRNVSFSYPTRPKELVFDRFSLCIPHGTSTALVGKSGTGKSTVISLIERFYDPQAGEVLIDNVNLREFQLMWIRSKIALVNQEPMLFTGSIKDNIAYGKGGATLDEMREATKLANVYDFINELPQGLDTMVGENGIQLSGGQKQRVAIARAILKDPKILLLDEATSALDAESERHVQNALEKVMLKRTTVIVSHRLSTIRNASVIAVLDQGKVVEKGTHFELLKDPQGMYSNLVQSQQMNEEAGNNKTDYSERIPFDPSLSSRSDGVGNVSIHSLSSLKPEQDTTYRLETSKYFREVSFLRLAHLNKPELPFLVVGTIFAIITGSIFPVFGLLISRVISTFYEMPHELKKDSEFWALIFVILGVVSLITCPLRTYLFGIAGSKLVQRVRLMCFEKVISMEVGWFDEADNSSGMIGARLSTDATAIRALVGDALAQVVEQASAVVAGLAIAFGASWQLALINLAMVPLLGMNGHVLIKSAKGFNGDAKVMYAEASQVAYDAIVNIRTVASFCTQENIIETYKRKCEGSVVNGAKQGLICGIGFGSSMCFLYLVYATSFYAGAQLVHDGKITMLDVFCVFYSLATSAIAISLPSLLAPDSSKAKNAATSVFTILDRKSKIDYNDESGMTLENVNGEIKLINVNFRYPTRPGVQVLRNLSLTIRAGKMVALVGESGSGKSTVISLLQRFYDPDSGQITLDGIGIQMFQVKWLRQRMGLVSQEPVLFNQTIRSNISFGKEGDATEAEIIVAAKLANAHEFISGLQQGYDTIVGERGIQLSGGQKQRVAIARAIVKSPRILLLDEATSALDVESEKIVQEALDRVMVNRTTVVVAHRLSTIKGADKIFVINNGSIVEKGNHQSLVNIKDGLYSSLARLHMTSLH